MDSKPVRLVKPFVRDLTSSNTSDRVAGAVKLNVEVGLENACRLLADDGIEVQFSDAVSVSAATTVAARVSCSWFTVDIMKLPLTPSGAQSWRTMTYMIR